MDIRVAVLEDGDLMQLFTERIDNKSIVGNIYKGRVEAIVPGLKAVFVDIGLERNAFLHFSDVRSNFLLPDRGAPRRSAGKHVAEEEDYADADVPDEEDETPEEEGQPKRKLPAAKPEELRIGDEVLIQVLKEPISTKGPRVTTYITLPGRYMVYLPFSEKEGGVSRRIEDGVERRRLRTILREVDSKKGSFIIRTAGLEQDEEEIKSDVDRLSKLWERIRRSGAARHAPSLVYDDHEILGRLVRDDLHPDTDALVVDSHLYARQLRQILASLVPSLKNRVIEYDDPDINIFAKYDVEKQFQKALRRQVWMKSGGYIIIEETEALVAIDVNSGKFVGKGDQEDTILKINLEASVVIARQLRLRDVGGIIVIDFIDMKSRENQRKLQDKFRELLKRDRAKTTVTPLTEYGLMQMTRKRVRQSLSKTFFRECPYCGGMGRIINEVEVWKSIKYEIPKVLKEHQEARALRITLHPNVRKCVENDMLASAREIANRRRVALHFVDDESVHLEHYEIVVQ
jgi:ribonuclease G